MKNLLTLILVFLVIPIFAQNFRYTNTIFPSSTKNADIIYGTAPFINFPYHNENNTSTDDLVMDIYEPTGDNLTTRPAIVFAHSGAFLTGDRNHDDMVALCDSFARKGYVTATIDYRKGFYVLSNVEMHSVRGAYRGLQDGRSAVRFLRANAATYNIDPTRVYFVGSSAGAFIGLHSIYMDTPSEKPADANAVNYFNLIPPWFFSGSDLGDFDEGNHLGFSGTPEAVVAMWGAVEDTSLITTTNDTPIFLIHGEDDTTVPFGLGYPFGISLFPETYGSDLINERLNNIGFTNKETYFVPGQPHEFYGVSNGAWNNGTNGNIYWDTVLQKTNHFFWQQHKPIADFSFSEIGTTVDFTDFSAGATAWWWDFGDGNLSTEQHPTHTYSSLGDYDVHLYIENEIQSWDTITYPVSLVGALPVTWLSPLVARFNNQHTELDWSIAEQINNEKFVVEHSSDGYIFEPIGEVAGDGNFAGAKHFSFTHKNPTIGLHYYRIQQMDFDGRSARSNIASVNVEGETPIVSIFPNPASEKLTIRASFDSPKWVDIFSSTGILIYSFQTNELEHQINVSSFENGFYFLKSRDGSVAEKLTIWKK